MNKNKIIITLLIISFGYFFINFLIDRKEVSSIKNIFSTHTKFIIKKYFFPQKYISQLEEALIKNKINTPINNVYFALDKELKFQKNLETFEGKKVRSKKLEQNKILDIYKLTGGFYSGINNAIPGSGYFDFKKDNIIIVSSKGTLGYSAINKKKYNFQQIENNIKDFIDFEQLAKHNWFSIKDLLVHNDYILLSYTEEIKEDCWNTSIIYGKLDYNKIEFSKLFSDNDCIHSINNADKEFNAHQSGGKIISLDDENIIFSNGDYRSRHLAQNLLSLNGKLIKININSKNTEIISIGHRNPQGLYLNKEKNFLLESEHGPKGGDEINLISLAGTSIPNFGWPVASYGEHYKRYNVDNLDKYEKYPLYKSHKEHGFTEPLKFFTPSIGISEITGILDNRYVVSSLKSKSLYFFEMSEEYKISKLEKVNVFERVRDLKFYKNKLFLFLEDTASIGVISFN